MRGKGGSHPELVGRALNRTFPINTHAVQSKKGVTERHQISGLHTHRYA